MLRSWAQQRIWACALCKLDATAESHNGKRMYGVTSQASRSLKPLRKQII